MRHPVYVAPPSPPPPHTHPTCLAIVQYVRRVAFPLSPSLSFSTTTSPLHSHTTTWRGEGGREGVFGVNREVEMDLSSRRGGGGGVGGESLPQPKQGRNAQWELSRDVHTQGMQILRLWEQSCAPSRHLLTGYCQRRPLLRATSRPFWASNRTFSWHPTTKLAYSSPFRSSSWKIC